MAISEFEIKRCERELEKFLEKHRPPTHIRLRIDIGYRINNQSVEIFEVRPYRKNPEETTETPVAKATYAKKHNHWVVYWRRADMKWHSYEPEPTVKRLEDFLDLISEDKHRCFFG